MQTQHHRSSSQTITLEAAQRKSYTIRLSRERIDTDKIVDSVNERLGDMLLDWIEQKQETLLPMLNGSDDPERTLLYVLLKRACAFLETIASELQLSERDLKDAINFLENFIETPSPMDEEDKEEEQRDINNKTDKDKEPMDKGTKKDEEEDKKDNNKKKDDTNNNKREKKREEKKPSASLSNEELRLKRAKFFNWFK